MTLEEKVRPYIVLGKFLKDNEVTNEKLGKLFLKLIDEIDYKDLGLFICKEPISICDVIQLDPHDPCKGIVLGCPLDLKSGEEVFSQVVNYLISDSKENLVVER